MEGTMLQSKQYTYFGSLHSVHTNTSFSKHMQRIWEKVSYLIQPVDTTDQPGSRKYRAILRKTGEILNVVKGLWWMLAAIGMALVIAQLG